MAAERASDSADAVATDMAGLSLKRNKNNELDPLPEYIQYRIDMFEALKKEYDDYIAAQPRKPIQITLKDGRIVEGTSYETTPMQIAVNISKSLAESLVIAKVNGELWDTGRPLESDCSLELLDFDTEDGTKVFWHSSAHVLGEACEKYLGCHLCIGPPLNDGFYYEFGTDQTISSTQDYKPLEKLATSVIKEKQKFDRLEVSKENLLKMFKHNKYKQQIIDSKIPDGTSTTVYRCGTLIDLCRGPHIPHTGKIKALKITKNSASYFLGDQKNDSLQRVYGISFPSKQRMDEYLKFVEEAAKRDHRKIGKDQELFFFSELSPGSAFWLPHGARIYNTLVDLMKSEYHKRGYQEVISPNMYNSKLWETSGHWQKYREDMFTLDVEKEKFGLKPMNCPGHCLIFKNRERSYRELPWRVADFGVLHRNEASGALSGLTRVRRFQQDDAHIFCRFDQIESEISGIFDFLKSIYGYFGFPFKLALSTRPENYIGELETWNRAEEKLTQALNSWTTEWEINPQDGAFYGPKIDITIQDALGRSFQCATIQLDFQLPERFDLQYHADTSEGSESNYARPVMIHRAILGSVERMTAILIEHFGGKWPFWLSPRQVLVVPVGPKFFDYASEVASKLHAAGLYSDADLSANTLMKKVRQGQLHQYNFIFIVGQEELEARSVNIRNRDDPKQQNKTEAIPLDQAIEKLLALKASRNLNNEL
ncbi:hypothetical protein CANCADRAFT_33015 [Tortispora caseinolytica NRRL Y-17796]|uniref:Threonine--tRNA ligase, cytoplasmic n=1 Tax=Tortispora caseinolytica NRRL Y-17796 TaxID=767744 RepID=A0A1E4T9K4_9ASCO|nr:hypothetical protein CANCADRAFT_33015 [Tortispora caseinolytica NRRL Y-17796]